MKLLELAKKLEEEGRNRAYNRQEIPFNDSAWLEQIKETSIDMAEELEKLGHPEWADVADMISLATEGVLADVVEWCSTRKVPRGECYVPPSVESDIEMLDEAYKATGEGGRCSYLRGRVEPYTLSAAINDLTACYHRVLEKLSSLSLKFEKVGKCLFRDADPALRDACLSWNRAAEVFHRNGLYTESTWEAMYYRAEDGEAEVRVGELPGHLSRLNLKKGTVEYYGTEDDAKLAEALFEQWCRLTCVRREGVVKCDGLNKGNVQCASEALASLASSRFRIAEPEKWWKTIPEECSRKQPIQREKCLIEQTLQKLKVIIKY